MSLEADALQWIRQHAIHTAECEMRNEDGGVRYYCTDAEGNRRPTTCTCGLQQFLGDESWPATLVRRYDESV